MRILIGLVEVAGYGTRLVRGFEALGMDATFANLHDPPAFRFGGGSAQPIVRLAQRVMQRRVRCTNGAARAFWLALELAMRVLLLGWASLRFDAFIFLIGNSFLWGYDLPLLRALGKRVVLVYLGSDERPPYLNGVFVAQHRQDLVTACLRAGGARKRRLRQAGRHAELVVSHVFSSHFQAGPIVPFLWMGFPSEDLALDVAPAPRAADAPTRILHAPSNPESKGTEQVRAAIARLRARGHALEYVELSGRPHAEVLAELRSCDFVVDEVWSDTPLGGLATEAASFGKPAVVGGYGWARLRALMPADAIPPSAACHPDDLEATIERLALDPGSATALGAQARQFLASRWRPQDVARRYLDLFDGARPGSDWVTDPGSMAYAHGYGMPEPRLRGLLRALLAQAGVAGLQLEDRPELERCLLDFAHQPDPAHAETAG